MVAEDDEDEEEDIVPTHNGPYEPPPTPIPTPPPTPPEAENNGNEGVFVIITDNNINTMKGAELRHEIHLREQTKGGKVADQKNRLKEAMKKKISGFHTGATSSKETKKTNRRRRSRIEKFPKTAYLKELKPNEASVWRFPNNMYVD